jgi:hypothetical protein
MNGLDAGREMSSRSPAVTFLKCRRPPPDVLDVWDSLTPTWPMTPSNGTERKMTPEITGGGEKSGSSSPRARAPSPTATRRVF